MEDRRNIFEWWTARKVALLLLATSLVVIVGGSIWRRQNLQEFITEFHANVGTELASIAFTVLVIDWLNEQREQRAETRRERGRLIQQLGSRVNEDAIRAADELRRRGWLSDGTPMRADLRKAELQGVDLNGANFQCADLRGANLQGAGLNRSNLAGALLTGTNLREAFLELANLEFANLSLANLEGVALGRSNLTGADLSWADLQGADLSEVILTESDMHGANLQGASLRWANLLRANLENANLQGAHNVIDEQLSQASALFLATMPDGSRYDGRFKLAGDISKAQRAGIDPNDSQAMARWHKESNKEQE